MRMKEITNFYLHHDKAPYCGSKENGLTIFYFNPQTKQKNVPISLKCIVYKYKVVFENLSDDIYI